MAPIGTALDRQVLRIIRQAYLAGKLRRTRDCVEDMLRDGLYECDVEKVIMEATVIEKAMPATSRRASNPNNTHFVIQGSGANGAEVYCKVCSNYHPLTNEFIEWKLTSFQKNEGKQV